MAERFEQSIKFRVENLEQIKSATKALEKLVQVSKALDGTAAIGSGTGRRRALSSDLAQRAQRARANLQGVELDVLRGKINSFKQLGLAIGSVTKSVRSLQRQDNKYNNIALTLEKTHNRLRNTIRKRTQETDNLAKSEANLAAVGQRSVGGGLVGRRQTVGAENSKINSSASFLLQNIGFGIQDAPFGIRGVANNISSSVTAFALLKREVQAVSLATGKSISVFSALKAALRGPTGIIILLGSVLPAALTLLERNWDSVSEAIFGATSKIEEFAEAAKKVREESKKAAINPILGTFLKESKERTESGFTGNEGELAKQLATQRAQLATLEALAGRLAISGGVETEELLEAVKGRKKKGFFESFGDIFSGFFPAVAPIPLIGGNEILKQNIRASNERIDRNIKDKAISEVLKNDFSKGFLQLINKLIAEIETTQEAIKLFGDVFPKAEAFVKGGLADFRSIAPISDLGTPLSVVTSRRGFTQGRDSFASVFEDRATRELLRDAQFGRAREISAQRQAQREQDIRASAFETITTFNPNTGESSIERVRVKSARQVQAELIEIEREGAEERKRITEQEIDAKAAFMRSSVSIATDIATLITGANDKQSRKAFNIAKFAAIGENAIQTQVAMAKAEGQLGFAGIPLSKILLVRGIARGLVIAAQKYNKPSTLGRDGGSNTGVRRAFSFNQISSNNFGGLFGLDGQQLNNNLANGNNTIFGQFTMREGTKTIVTQGQMQLQRRNEQRNLNYLSQ